MAPCNSNNVYNRTAVLFWGDTSHNLSNSSWSPKRDRSPDTVGHACLCRFCLFVYVQYLVYVFNIYGIWTFSGETGASVFHALLLFRYTHRSPYEIIVEEGSENLYQ